MPAFFPLTIVSLLVLGRASPEGNDFMDSGIALRIPRILLVLIPAVGLFLVGGQILARVSPGVTASTSRVILGATSLLLHFQTWNEWNLHPALFAAWLGIAGGALAVWGEGLALRRATRAASSA